MIWIYNYNRLEILTWRIRFFDSLKAAYPEFEVWYAKKAAAGEKAPQDFRYVEGREC